MAAAANYNAGHAPAAPFERNTDHTKSYGILAAENVCYSNAHICAFEQM